MLADDDVGGACFHGTRRFAPEKNDASNKAAGRIDRYQHAATGAIKGNVRIADAVPSAGGRRWHGTCDDITFFERNVAHYAAHRVHRLALPASFRFAGVLAALLGTREHGRWQLAPRDPEPRISRRYLGDSLMLETEFTSADRVVRVIDCLPPRRDGLDVVRIVEGVEGEVAVEMELIIRFDYGSIIPWVRRVDGLLVAIGGPDALSLWTPVRTHGVDLTTRASFTVHPGERVPFVLNTTAPTSLRDPS